MSAVGQVSRRDFLRLRPTARGRVLELSCRALFMRCTDAGLEADTQRDYEPWMGEPPAVLGRAPVAALLDRIERELGDVQAVRLLEPEWLSAIGDGGRLEAAIAAFRARGGAVEIAAGAGEMPR